jgi:hypothetical protein
MYENVSPLLVFIVDMLMCLFIIMTFYFLVLHCYYGHIQLINYINIILYTLILHFIYRHIEILCILTLFYVIL